MLPDPAMFSVEGVVFGVTSADVLFHLGKEELARQVVRTDRIKRLASHIIQQGLDSAHLILLSRAKFRNVVPSGLVLRFQNLMPLKGLCAQPVKFHTHKRNGGR